MRRAGPAPGGAVSCDFFPRRAQRDAPAQKRTGGETGRPPGILFLLTTVACDIVRAGWPRMSPCGPGSCTRRILEMSGPRCFCFSIASGRKGMMTAGDCRPLSRISLFIQKYLPAAGELEEFDMRIFKTVLFAGLVLLLSIGSVRAATYEIGPGKTYETIGAFAWENLAAGDTVKIYYKSTPYYEKFGVWAQGTSTSPVTIQGVAGSGGELPVIDGIDATTRLALDYWGEERSIIKIGGCSVPSGDPTPSYLVFENLDVKSARPPYSFTCDAGTEKDYVDKAASFYIEKGNNITIRNCILRDCGNGFMTSNASEDILLEGCHLYDNGITDSIYQHSIYTESHGIIFQWNHLDALRSGCTGNNLKDRSSGTVIRYNWIEDGNRQLDLVDSEFLAIREETDYGKDYVYGNVLYETGDVGNRQMVHYGGDSGTTSWYRPGPLRFYNNTCISKRTVSTYLFRRSDDETIDCYNTIAYVTAAGNTFYVVESDGNGTVTVSYNWFKTGYNLGEATDGGNNVTGSDPGFVNFSSEDFHLTSNSDCVDAGRSLMSGDPAVTYQYVKHHDKETRPTDSTMDIGAFEYDSGAPPPELQITTTSLPNGAVNTAYSETLAATGGVTPYTWSVISGSLPSGLSLASSTGLISGTPTSSGTSNFTVQVTDSQDPADTDTQALSITIDPEPEPPTITTTSLPDGTKNQPYSQTVQATGGTTPYTWSIVSGSLPKGLSLNSSTGEISGKPKPPTGTSNFTVRCTDDKSLYDDQALSITING